jgi:hypothetical protein
VAVSTISWKGRRIIPSNVSTWTSKAPTSRHLST